MADANSNEATVQALMSARRIIDTCINTVREWERDNNGGNYSTSARAAKLAVVTSMNSNGVATYLTTAKYWDGSATS